MLVWMAYGMARTVPTLRLGEAAPGLKGRNLMLMGALLSLSTPYWTLWWATIGLGYIVSSARSGLPGLAAFYTGHILGDLTWYGALSFAIGTGRRFMTDAMYRALMWGCAALLACLAVWFAATGVNRLLGA
jgi:threonine/homoserine/homoserine lactone efflux protein